MGRVAMPAILLGVLVAAASARAASATPATGVVSIMLARGTIGPFRSQARGFTIDARTTADVVVARVTLAVGGNTGWHTHAGPVFAVVKAGHLAVTRAQGARGCTTRVYGPGQAFIEAPDMVHIGRNAGATPVVLIATYTNVPVGGAPATSAAAPAACR